MYMAAHREYEVRAERRHRLRLVLLITAVAVLIAGGMSGSWLLFRHKLRPVAANAAVETQKPAIPAPVKPAYTAATGHYLFNGTIFWGRAIERDARKAGNFGRSLGNIATFHRENYDAWMGDLECPVADLTVPYQRQVDLLNFNCPPEFASYFTKYFDLINLANNHTGDQGHDAFLETQQHLTAAGAQVFGSYDISDDTNRCEVISLPVRLKKSEGTEEKAALPVAFCSYHALVRMPTAAEVAEVTRYSKLMPTIAFAHMGVEYTPKATASQEQFGHEMIDAGADFVIMNHPHWVQNTEAYKGKLIVYSTGNFIFDQLTSEELRSASIDVTMNTKYSDNLAAWIKLDNDCKARTLHDSCLMAAQNANLTKPAVSYSFSLVAGDELTQRWIPQRANPTIQQAVEARTNWTQTTQNLHY